MMINLLSLRRHACQRFSRWLLLLVVCWQVMLLGMPLAQAKAADGEGQWETVCTMQGSSKVWVAGGDAGDQPQVSDDGQCPLCVMSQTGIAPPPRL